MKKVSNENQMFLFGDLDTAVIERPPAVLKPIVKAIQAQLKAVSASSKETPCFAAFAFAFLRSHSNLTNLMYDNT